MNKLLLFAVCFLLQANAAFAQSYAKDEALTRCNALGNELGSAISGRDYKSLKMLVSWGLKNCKKHIDRDAYYEQYGSLALAERELKNYPAAIQAANECIKNRYGITSCHVEKAAIYIDLGDLKNAIPAAKTTKLIAASNIEEIKRKLRNDYVSRSEKEMLESLIDFNESVLVFVNKFLENNEK